MSRTDTPPMSFGQKFLSSIGSMLNDLTYIDVITLIGDPKETTWDYQSQDVREEIKKMKNVHVLARTVIELDGDIISIVPGNPETGTFNGDTASLDYHKENVQVAIQNWNVFVNTMISTTRMVLELVGLKDTDEINKFLGSGK